jgi:hypothetical protein
MATQAQLEANARNAKLSTGPRTPEGKAIVSQNRTTHGLTGAHVILPGEDPKAFDALLEAYRAEHQPQGPTADFLVQTLAQSQWKLDRIARLEAKVLAKEPDTVSDELLRLSRYESAARRAWSAALKQLNDLRKLQAQQQKAAEDAARAAKARSDRIEELKCEAEFRQRLYGGGNRARRPAAFPSIHDEMAADPGFPGDENGE